MSMDERPFALLADLTAREGAPLVSPLEDGGAAFRWPGMALLCWDGLAVAFLSTPRSQGLYGAWCGVFGAGVQRRAAEPADLSRAPWDARLAD